ncbi:MAG: TonB-dependent receptor [Methylobacter sp.]|nr:TonB-dependent receptor [Methylobacter sp.]
MKSTGTSAALMLLAIMQSQSAIADAEQKQNFNIPAQSLSSALLQFSENTGVKTFFSADLTRDIKTQGLSGSYTPQQALDKLLANTGVAYRFTDTESVALSVAPKKNSVEATMLKPMTVTGKTGYADNDPYNTDYNRTNATTATKTNTSIMQTPMSVKVVPQQVLKDQQVVTLDQALKNVSGVVSGSGSDRQFFIRGFDVYNYYRDGFPFVSNWFHTEELANIERVEVLKGPGSILYGRAEPGGIINFVTKQPLDTPYYSLRQQFGSYDHYRTDIDATGPLTANKDLAYRFNLAYQTNNSITEFAGGERIFVAPQLRWNISDKTVSNIKLEYSNIKRNADNLLPLNTAGTQPAALSRSQNLSDPWSYMEDEYVMLSLNTEHKFNPNWSLRHRFNASFANGSGINVSASGKVAANGDVGRFFFEGNANGNDYFNNFYNSLELTGKFDTGFLKHTTLVGGDYMNTDARATMGPIFGLNPAGTNIYNPVHFAQAPAVTAYNTFGYSQPWFGLYGQDQIELPYHVHLLAGLRYDNAETGGDSAWGAFGNNTKIINPTVTDDKVSPRGGLLWQPIPELSLYGSYTENFGASNGNNAQGNRLPAQTAQQWEVGAKTELWNGRFTSTLAYFDLTKQNLPMQVAQGISRAVGEAESRGIELDLTGEILPGWKVIGAYAYTPFAKTIKDSIGAGTEGMRLHNAPVNNGNLWTTYEFQDRTLHGLKLGAGVQAVGMRQIGYTEAIKTPGYATLNLMASQSWKVSKTNVTAQLNADNLLDKTYHGGIYSYGPALYGAPRTFMGSIKIEY